jgi:signal transduction histidine kinase
VYPSISHLTALLRERKELLLQRWASRVRSDPKLRRASKLSEDELRDYTPKLIDDLVASLVQRTQSHTPGGASGPEIGGSEAAEIHVRHRLADGFTLAEELRELSALRSVIVELCTQEGVVLGGEESELVHSAIDEVMTTAAVQMEHATSADLRRDVVLRELFIAVLGHDLRDPLHAVQFAAASLLRRADVPQAAMKVVQRIAASGERAKRLVDDMLDLTRVRVHGGLPITPKRVDLRSICREVIEELELSRPDRTIRFKALGDGHGAWDLGRMGQLVSNLISNALDYSPPEEPVRVELGGKKSAVVLEVNNRGTPIPPELLPVIFDPFRRGEQDRGELRRPRGLGLGLFIAKAIVDAHGGSVEITSTPEEGTTFRVSLPRSAPAST